ncbi:PREDICTED: coiled-coil domain-containing protein 180, partial [Gekko japonicus]|uniref:ribonuclease H n=1 Tax=Gekko japonicus TaxID=146911 RepID=A0ABM1JZ71_GEKJA
RYASNGFLSDRQQMWVDGMPNDDFTENPVLYKEAMTLTFQKTHENEDMAAAREVRNLAEVIIPEKKNSDIIQRISEARRRRHEDAVATLRRELASIGRERELSILEPGRLFLTRLAGCDENIECLLQRIENDFDLKTYSMQCTSERGTAFNTTLGPFDYLVMPFGLAGAPGVLMNLINEVLHKYLLKGVLVFLDDILICSKEKESRVQLLRDVPSALYESRLFAKLSKCKFRKEELDFLGYRISGRGLHMDPHKVQDVLGWALPLMDLLEMKGKGPIKDTLRKYTKILEDTAYLLSSDIHRIIHKEAMMINQALLANRRAVARLFVNLMEADLKKDVSFRRKLKERIQAWKTMQKEFILCSFRKFMENERIQNPSIVKNELENMLKDQLTLSDKRTALLYSLGNLLPLTHSKAEINEWYESVVALNKRIGCRKSVVCGVTVSVTELHVVFLVGREPSEHRSPRKTMRLNDFEQLAKHTEINCRHLYQYFQDALVLWDVHQHNLVHLENDLHSKLNDLRNKHENLNKLREVHLDIAIDKLRTQGSEEKLKAQLEKVYTALDCIQAGYEAFHQDLETKIGVYPQNVLKELIAYSACISQYFHVKETYEGEPLRKARAEEEEEEAEMAEDAEEAEGAAEAPECVLEHVTEEGEGHKDRPEERDEHEAAEGAEPMESLGGMESPPPESEGMETGTSLGLTSDSERSEDGTEVREAGEAPETGEAVTPKQVEVCAPRRRPSERVLECFTTASGNTYTVFEPAGKRKTRRSEKYYAGKLKEDQLPSYVEQVYLSQTFDENARRQIRLQFFEHLEKWFAQTLSAARAVMASKKEELSSELQLRIHLHEPRRGRIEKDVFQVRLVELQLHNDRLARHCAGVVEALNQEKTAFQKLQEGQNTLSKNFRKRIQDMEDIFLRESRAEKLMALSNNLHTELLNHMEVMQVSLRSYRQYLEEALGKLREANTDFLKACRLFSEGGNFCPEELDHFVKSLQKETGRIDFVEGLIMIDMEKMESSHLEQAIEITSKFENRFRYLAVDRVFMEKIQRFMTNLQVKIKLEVAKSNFQSQTLSSHLETLLSRIDACAHPNVDKEPITSKELYEFAKFVMEKLKERSKYLNCLLGQDFALALPDPPTQSSTEPTSQSGSFQQDSKVTVMGVERTPLMTPSRMGKTVFDDAAIGVVKHLTGMQRSKRTADQQQQHEKEDRVPLGTGGVPAGAGVGGVYCPVPTFPATFSGNARGEVAASPASLSAMPAVPKKSVSFSKKVSVGSTVSMQKYIKQTKADKKFQVFGDKPKDSDTVSMQKYIKQTKADKKFQVFGDKPKDSDWDHFKGIIFNTVWDNFDILMNVAEDFYRKDKHQITRPEYLQETYDQCVDVMGQKLLLFRDQLKRFEELLPDIVQLVTDKVLKDHEQLLLESTEQIRRDLQEQLQKGDLQKDKNKNQLRPTLGHPENVSQLEALCLEEEGRQKEQVDGIRLCTQKLEACAVECAQSFVSTLAACTEKILVELDDSLTIDDVQMAETETPKEKTSTLIRRKKAGLSLAAEACKLVAERGSRTWPGIPRTTLVGFPDQILCQETAAVTTAKTTLGHVAAVEERDAVYMTFKQVLEAEFARTKEENAAHLNKAQHWADWWKKSVQKIKQLYS